jgi:hypothetical protein
LTLKSARIISINTSSPVEYPVAEEAIYRYQVDKRFKPVVQPDNPRGADAHA